MTGGSPATSEMVGRTCPYCRFGLELGVPVVACPVCKAVHHDDCWDENGGCAVALCAGGPSLEQVDQEGGAEAVDPAPAPDPDPEPPPPLPPVEPLPSATPTEKLEIPRVAVAPPPGPASSSPPPPRGGGSRLGWVPLIAAAIVLAGGGVAAAIVLSGGTGSSDATATENSSTSEFEEEGEIGDGFEDEEEGFEEEEFEPPEPPPSPAQRAQRQVQQALRAHFDRLAEGSYESAYYDLTPDQRGEIGSESGWVEAHEEDQLESFDLSVDASLTGSNSAEARIVNFRTRALASGCKDWYGHWGMRKIYGEWLIDAAELEDEPC